MFLKISTYVLHSLSLALSLSPVSKSFVPFPHFQRRRRRGGARSVSQMEFGGRHRCHWRRHRGMQRRLPLGQIGGVHTLTLLVRTALSKTIGAGTAGSDNVSFLLRYIWPTRGEWQTAQNKDLAWQSARSDEFCVKLCTYLVQRMNNECVFGRPAIRVKRERNTAQWRLG